VFYFAVGTRQRYPAAIGDLLGSYGFVECFEYRPTVGIVQRVEDLLERRFLAVVERIAWHLVGVLPPGFAPVGFGCRMVLR